MPPPGGSSLNSKGRPSAGGFNPCRVLSYSRALGGSRRSMLPEFVVQADPRDVILELDGARMDVAPGNGEGTICEGRVVVELHVEELALQRPAIADGVFDTAADGPAGAGIALLMAGGGGERREGSETLRPCRGSGKKDGADEAPTRSSHSWTVGPQRYLTHPSCCVADRPSDMQCARAPRNRAILWLARFRRSRTPRRPGC
jgi:hypothetical protein